MFEIPDSEHIIRYASPSKWDARQNLIRTSAFQLRTEKNEQYLSCNHSEFRKNNIKDIITDMQNHDLTIKSNGVLFRMPIQTIKQIAKLHNIEIKVHRHSNVDSYSGIYNTLELNNNDEFLAEMANEASKSLIILKDI